MYKLGWAIFEVNARHCWVRRYLILVLASSVQRARSSTLASSECLGLVVCDNHFSNYNTTMFYNQVH